MEMPKCEPKELSSSQQRQKEQTKQSRTTFQSPVAATPHKSKPSSFQTNLNTWRPNLRLRGYSEQNRRQIEDPNKTIPHEPDPNLTQLHAIADFLIGVGNPNTEAKQNTTFFHHRHDCHCNTKAEDQATKIEMKYKRTPYGDGCQRSQDLDLFLVFFF